jgi:CBS-domain-containing membrane protein
METKCDVMETKRTVRGRANLRNWWMLTAGALGGALAIGGMLWFSAFSAFPLAAIPFATSIVLVMGSPEAEPAQPRALIGGHLVATLVGLVVLQITGPQPWAAAVAVGLSMLAMQITGTFHPPAGINPLLVVTMGMSWSFLLVPVAAGACMLVALAFAWHNIGGLRPWPRRWW